MVTGRFLFFNFSGLLKMFHLMDRVPDGVQPMIQYLENHVVTTGLADMIGAAATIATVRILP